MVTRMRRLYDRALTINGATMLFVQLTGLSGAGKTTLSGRVKLLLEEQGLKTVVVDADVFRRRLCPDLGFSKEDRNENIRRLGFVANLLATNGVIALLAAINPYEEIRRELREYGRHVKTVWIDCDLDTLVKRDTKQLYRKALLPDGHPEKISNLTGVNDPYDIPLDPDLIIHTGRLDVEQAADLLYRFILQHIPPPASSRS